MRLSKSIAACLVASAAGAEVSVTKCTTGAADILGTLKVHTAQVCNLFGSTCYLNHPSTEAANCGTEALEIKTGECKLYPIRNFKDNAVRTGADAVEYMTVVSNYGCSVTPKSDGAFTYSGACVSMQCEMGSADARTYAGLAYSNKDGKARVAVTDTTTHEFLPQTVASISDAADQLKNVFLVRTGNYIASTKNSKSSSGDWHSRSGELPTSDGNNYGPVACPSSGNLITSAKADAITSENLRMCGTTGKWVYYNALNLVLDKSMYAKYSNDVGKDTPININAVPFLFGKSAYKKGDAMDDPRMVMLNDGKAAADAIYMTSNAISPKPGNKEPFSKEIGGAWRSYGVAFYCDDYARTDLTKCAADNRKMLYVGDPAPNVAFGTAMAVSSSAGLMGAKCTDGGDCCSGSCVETFCAPGCETSGAAGGAAVGSDSDGSSSTSSASPFARAAMGAMSVFGAFMMA